MRSRRRLFVALTGAAAIVMAAGCSNGQPAGTSSVDSIEIDGDQLFLPRTDLVTCHSYGNGEYLLWWEGTNVEVPRRPLEHGHSSTLSLRFSADPPVAQAFALKVAVSGKNAVFEWPGSGSAPSKTLALDSSHNRYVLVAHLADSNSSTQHDIRVVYQC
jgi:hypothetical protein